MRFCIGFVVCFILVVSGVGLDIVVFTVEWTSRGFCIGLFGLCIGMNIPCFHVCISFALYE